MAKAHPAIEVHVTRGNLTESVHLVDAVIVDSKAQPLFGFGAWEKVLTFPRSTIKMIQALPLVESGAYSDYGLTPSHLSLACASHNGEVEHTELVLSWLEQIGLQESDLVCGPQMPYDLSTAHQMIRNEKPFCRRHNNCSGKHAGIVSFLKKEKLPIQNYGNYDHPLQQKFRQILSEVSGESIAQAPWGVDGCAIPTYGMSLLGMAKALSVFLLDQPQPTERQQALKTIRDAVLSQPFYLGGTNDFCTDVIAEAQGRCFVKAGAEGVHGGAIFQSGLAFALKVRDGNSRASKVALSKILQTFQGLSDSQFMKLSRHTETPILNTVGETVGKIFVPAPLIG